MMFLIAVHILITAGISGIAVFEMRKNARLRIRVSELEQNCRFYLSLTAQNQEELDKLREDKKCVSITHRA